VIKLAIPFVCVPIVAVAMMPLPIAAAVRICKASVSSGPQAAASVAAGQKLALSVWAQVAKVMGGDSHTSWRLAVDKTLTCAPAADKGVLCEARGRPCVIEQAAPKEWAPGKPNTPEPKVVPVPPTKAINI
jgi:hypothetical protein